MFAGNRQVQTSRGLLDVDVWVTGTGSHAARLHGQYPGLEAVGGAFGATSDEAVDRLREAVERA